MHRESAIILICSALFLMSPVQDPSIFAIQPDPGSHTGNHVPADEMDSAQSRYIQGLEQILHHRINQIRFERGFAPLSSNQQLHRIARRYSRLMNRLGYFGHFDPSGAGIADRISEEGLRFRFLAENIAKNTNFNDPVSVAVEGWMDSEGHRANILDPDFVITGIGIWKDGSTYYLTQIFMYPR